MPVKHAVTVPKTKPVRPEYRAIALRIRAAMAARSLDQSAVARALGIEPQSVQQWLAGQTTPRGYRIKELARLLEVPPWELLGGPDEARGNVASGGAVADHLAQAGTSPFVRRVPRLAWVSAGQFRELDVIASPETVEDWDSPSEPLGPRSFSLRVDGDSMEPEFPDGCIIFVDPSLRAASGDFVVVQLENQEQATFKQLVVDGPRRYLKPLNPRYPLIPIGIDAIVCGVVREMRKIYRPRRA